MSKVVHIITNDGSPIGVSEASIYGQDGRYGCGGAELALLTTVIVTGKQPYSSLSILKYVNNKSNKSTLSLS